jgi:hypothetical protein
VFQESRIREIVIPDDQEDFATLRSPFSRTALTMRTKTGVTIVLFSFFPSFGRVIDETKVGFGKKPDYLSLLVCPPSIAV